MGLDIGDRRIGVAISDSLKISANALTVIQRSDFKSETSILKKILTEHQVETIIAGLPKNMDGTIGDQAKSVQAYCDKLEEELDVPILLWDERLSSKTAEEVLISADVKRKNRKKMIDKVAAAVILQSYLDCHN